MDHCLIVLNVIYDTFGILNENYVKNKNSYYFFD